jgi:large subunit ribosomal protein L30
MTAKLKIRLIKSVIGKPQKHRSVVSGLGLKRLNATVELNDTPEVRGMISKISHMLHVV